MSYEGGIERGDQARGREGERGGEREREREREREKREREKERSREKRGGMTKEE